MRNIIQFHISKDGKYHTASGIDFPVVTQGETLDELTQNIDEAVSLPLEGEDLTEIGIESNTIDDMMTEARMEYHSGETKGFTDTKKLMAHLEMALEYCLNL